MGKKVRNRLHVYQSRIKGAFKLSQSSLNRYAIPQRYGIPAAVLSPPQFESNITNMGLVCNIFRFTFVQSSKTGEL